MKILQSKKIISKKYEKLKILGLVKLKNKVNLSVNFTSKQAKEKIEKIRRKININKKLKFMSSENLNPGAFSHATDLKNRIFFYYFFIIAYIDWARTYLYLG